MHGLHRLIDEDTKEAATCGWIVHEHVSVPFDPATSQAAFIGYVTPCTNCCAQKALCLATGSIFPHFAPRHSAVTR